MDGFEKFTSFFFTTGLNLQCSVTHGVVSLIISNPDLFASQVRSIGVTIPIKYLGTSSSCPATIYILTVAYNGGRGRNLENPLSEFSDYLISSTSHFLTLKS
ncbi:hypothetical protein GW17_00036382 [Ensete ventricosum]|nr:hypothetical protein GW17_00036382 [Ensete ventricosum]